MAQQFRILFQDENLVAVDKPAGFSVHPPEDKRIRISNASNGLQIISKQINQYVYPIHRLDRGTSGVVLYALNQGSAQYLASQFQNRLVDKKYYAIVRGWTEDVFTISRPLDEKEAFTSFATIARVELNDPVGKYSSARYSLLEAKPKTGRMHQIRRHLMGISHPIIGDKLYGDREHNRYMKEKFKFQHLMLKAHVLTFQNPTDQQMYSIESKWTKHWHTAFDLFGYCPIQNSKNKKGWQ